MCRDMYVSVQVCMCKCMKVCKGVCVQVSQCANLYISKYSCIKDYLCIRLQG